MNFEKRCLTEQERARLQPILGGIAEHRRPSAQQPWALDAGRGIYCTQLASSTWDMRDGRYWHLLVVDNVACIYHVDAFSAAPHTASIDRSGLTAQQVSYFEQLAREANAALCNGEQLDFKDAWYPML